MKRLMMVIGLGILLTQAGRGDRLSSRADEPRRTEPLAEFPIKDTTKLLTVPVMFQGKSYPFAIDTGASCLIYDKSFEERLGPAIDTGRLFTPHGIVPVKHYDAPDATLGPLSLRTDEHVTCGDLSFYIHPGFERVYGLIGMSFLKKYALTLNFSRRKIQFRHQAEIDEGQAIPIEFDRLGSPLIEVALPDMPRKPYILDTGCVGLGTTSLEQAVFDSLIQKGEVYFTHTSPVLSLSGSHTSRVGVIYNLQVGGAKLKQLYVSDTTNDRLRIGMDTISRLNLVLDFPRKKMVITKSSWW